SLVYAPSGPANQSSVFLLSLDAGDVGLPVGLQRRSTRFFSGHTRGSDKYHPISQLQRSAPTYLAPVSHLPSRYQPGHHQLQRHHTVPSLLRPPQLTPKFS